ncbi:DUF2069 domain-containing protein [Photobacterium sp. GB-72]|uniref:DUF2069 domain-containing protein n=1 Tax=Photobacterium sp. GB-72 TaxID=2022105 RepID=UPI000D16E72E|nr:DUF2069 domain-containing protein [Photobacterium sp. GB-72]PSV28521.1 DUF2069 domain-containing protein [Photobacterium sp. GB-72]
MPPMQPQTQYIHRFAVCANLTLMLWVALWQTIISPHPHLNNWVMAVVWIIPLLLPLRGMLAAKPYTYAWSNFILMFYFLHALTLLTIDEGERGLAGIELLLVTIAFLSNILFARVRAKELGIKLQRLSQVERQERERFEPPED